MVGATAEKIEHFKKLSASEKKDLLEEIRNRSVPLHFKFERSQVFRIKVLPLKKTMFLTAKRPSSLHSLFHMSAATVIIALGHERYFFSAPVIIEENMVHVRCDGDFYYLLRRKSRRFHIPSHYPAHYMVKRIDNTLAFLKATVRDLSEGGLRVSLNSDQPDVQVGSLFAGTLRISDKRGIDVQCIVKHHKKERGGPFKQTFGLEFRNLSEHTKSILSNQIFDLQRDLFLMFVET